MTGSPPKTDLSDALRGLPPSELRATMEAGIKLDDVVPLWFGESDEPTPGFIGEAAIAALHAGQTFYGSSAGLPALIDAVQQYTHRHYGVSLDASRVMPTASGLQGIMLTLQALIVTGGKFLVVGPTWPNVRNAAALSGARVSQFDLDFDGTWRLDIDQLIHEMGDDTRVLCVNSPANPSGWVASRDELAALLDACRRTDTWLLSDEVYGRLTFDAPRAPSLLDVSDAEDRVVIVNSFSKTWNMTGWRLGWLVLPAGLHGPFTQTIENNIANVPVFTQHAGAAALNEGDAFVAEARERLRARRDFAAEALAAWPGVRFARPDGAFYLFFAVEGVTDSVAFTQRLLREAKVGLAPGRAFGDAFDGWLRLTFACGEARLQKAFERLARFYA